MNTKKNKMTTIFLDIDGVLATVKQFNLSHNSKSWLQEYNVYPFDKKCVNVFNEILENTKTQIVISSDWRIYYTMEELDDIFKINGVLRSPMDRTQLFHTNALELEKSRAMEILCYVEDENIGDWIAIDDMNMSEWLEDRFFLCRSDFEGIKQTGLKEKILNYLI